MKSFLFSTLSTFAVAASLNAADAPQATTSATVALPEVSAFTAEQTKDIQKLVESTIQANPQLVLNALQAAMEQAKQQELEKLKTAVAANSAKIFNDPATPTTGTKNAPVQLAIFLDPNCGACKAFHKELNTYTKNNSDVEVIFKDISIFGEPSALVVRALLAAHQQGKYEKLQNAVLESKEKLDEKALVKLAKSLGLDAKKLQADINSDKIKQQLESNMQLAQAIGVSATPTWIVGTQVFQGGVPQDELKQIIASAKSGATAAAPAAQKQASN